MKCMRLCTSFYELDDIIEVILTSYHSTKLLLGIKMRLKSINYEVIIKAKG